MKLEPIPAGFEEEVGYTEPAQRDKQPFTHIYNYGQFRVTS